MLGGALRGSARRPTALLLGICLTFFLYTFLTYRRTTAPTYRRVKTLNKKLWQTSKWNVIDLDDQKHNNVDKWTDMNPTWQYELLTDPGSNEYVERRFAKEPDIIRVFTGLADMILRADLIRYLVLFGDGGVYSDIDTDCLKPIDEWIPREYRNATNAVVGIEYDTFGKGHGPALLDLQLVNWTLLSKAGHRLMEITVRNAIQAIKDLSEKQKQPYWEIKATFNDVLVTTGPALLTMSVFQYLSETTRTNFTWRNITNLEAPLLVHDVLILPVTAFGNGQSHSNAGPPTDRAALVHHQFSGSWKTGTHAFKNMGPASPTA